MKSKKITVISAIAVVLVVVGLIVRSIYLDTHYVKIYNKTYETDVKDIGVVSLDKNDHIRQINKCTALELLEITDTSENKISELKNFNSLNTLMIDTSEVSSTDCEKISNFNNLENLFIYLRSVVDFKGFNNNNVSHISVIYNSSAVNIASLSECPSLKKLSIWDSTVDNCVVIEDGGYTMKDSSVFASFDSVEELIILVNKIEDISGILEMDSLKTLKINKGTLSDGDKKLLEEKGVSVVENE